MTDIRRIRLYIDGQPVVVPAGASLAAAVARVTTCFRRSVDGHPRAPLCGMGVCFECRVRVDDELHVRACMTLAQENMRVCTHD